MTCKMEEEFKDPLMASSAKKEEGADEPQNTEFDVIYKVNDNPPWYLAIVLGFQQYMTMFGSTIAVPFILAGPLCIADNNLAKSELISTIFLVSGIATLIQSCLGTRLPIVQGATFSFIGPTIAILNLPEYKCPTAVNGTVPDYDWKIGMREIQGAIAVSSLFQVFVGCTGIIGFVMRFIGPLTVAPTIALVGLALFGAAGSFASEQWGIAALTVFCIALFSQVLGKKFAVFRLFPVILAILISWALSGIITAAGGYKEGSEARTDHNLEVLNQAKWIRVPYPGQWGTPTVHVAGVFGMLAGVFASMIESIGDYYACARLSGAPPPPKHAVNRGIFLEGISCVLAGLFGSGNGTTSYSENIAAIGVTKVASRRVIQIGAIFMIILSILGKFGAVFTLIPKPVIGGMFWCLFGLIVAVGLSSLQFVNLNDSRNLFVLGFSFFNGMVVPSWISANPQAIDTGVTELDQIIGVLLGTNMAVGGITACLLDNILPGSKKDRGIEAWRNNEASAEENSATYDLPYIQKYLDRTSWIRYVPFLPYNGNRSGTEQNNQYNMQEVA
ncbi:solute carrier family 23 member 1-like [Clytia hemisphaerica]|uniref:Uncharacterized protein n=1 Tax=Clytia hemisphaerica TaxID=252671 RepID=A0A7M6DKK4_9CNID